MVFIKRHVKLILVLTTLLIGSAWYIVKRENNYFIHLNCITKKFICEMEEKHGFSCFSIGGSLSGNIKKVSLKFYCFEKKSIEEARKLEIDCVERFCEMINSNKKIRPHLEEVPFTNERVGIMICFCKEDLTHFPLEESISLVMSCREKIFYEVEFNDCRPDQTVLEEPYREAYEKVKGISSDAQQQVTLQSKHQSQSSKNNKSLSQGSKPSIFDDAQQEALRREFEKLEKDYGFYKKAR